LPEFQSPSGIRSGNAQVNKGVKLIVPIATGLRSEGHWRGVTRGVQDDLAHGTVAARCGIGRVDQRGLSTREPGLHSWTAAILSEAVGRLTADVAHDFNNPLMSIGGSGRVDRDAAFLRSGVRLVPIIDGDDYPCGDPILLPDLRQIFDMLSAPEGPRPHNLRRSITRRFGIR
jgi:signal transduction histidine kinase